MSLKSKFFKGSDLKAKKKLGACHSLPFSSLTSRQAKCWQTPNRFQIVFLCIWRKEVEFLYVSAEDEQIEGGSAKLSGGRVFTGWLLGTDVAHWCEYDNSLEHNMPASQSVTAHPLSLGVESIQYLWRSWWHRLFPEASTLAKNTAALKTWGEGGRAVVQMVGV